MFFIARSEQLILSSFFSFLILHLQAFFSLPFSDPKSIWLALGGRAQVPGAAGVGVGGGGVAGGALLAPARRPARVLGPCHFQQARARGSGPLCARRPSEAGAREGRPILCLSVATCWDLLTEASLANPRPDRRWHFLQRNPRGESARSRSRTAGARGTELWRPLGGSAAPEARELGCRGRMVRGWGRGPQLESPCPSRHRAREAAAPRPHSPCQVIEAQALVA